MMDRFENESIYLNTVSSAPSSVMSCASMLTGLLMTYYKQRNYEDYKFDNNAFYSMNNWSFKRKWFWKI